MIDCTAFRITDDCIDRAPSFRLIMIVQKLLGQFEDVICLEGAARPASRVPRPARRSLYQLSFYLLDARFKNM